MPVTVSTGVLKTTEKLQDAPGASEAEDTLNLAVVSLVGELVNVEPVPQEFAEGSVTIAPDGRTCAISMKKEIPVTELAESVLVNVNVEVKLSPATKEVPLVLIVSDGAANTRNVVDTAGNVVAVPKVKLIVLVVLV